MTYKDLYTLVFSKEHSVGAWVSVGAVPVTRKCLESDKVCHNSKGDIEQANHLACDLLSSRGYHGIKLKLKLRNAITLSTITLLNSQDMINALINEIYHGQTFTALGSSHLCCNNEVFIASMLKERREERAYLLKEKASQLATEKLEVEAMAILESSDGDNQKKLKVVELQKPLLFYEIWRENQAKGAS